MELNNALMNMSYKYMCMTMKMKFINKKFDNY